MAHFTEPPRRLIVAMTGASGSIFGVRLLQKLRGTGIETHLVMSRWAARTLVHETPYTPEQVQKLADVVHPLTDQGASISSGSFLTMGMVVVPCSARTLAAIAHGIGDNLIHRAADVVLKERRKLVLAVRESPLSEIHLENMLKLSRMGVVISPPLPAFYTRPASIDEMVDHSVSRILDQLGIHLDANRWSGEMEAASERPTDALAWTSTRRSGRSSPSAFFTIIAIALPFRIRSQSTGEKLDRTQEGIVDDDCAAARRPCCSGASVIAFMISPASMAWSSLPLPAVAALGRRRHRRDHARSSALDAAQPRPEPDRHRRDAAGAHAGHARTVSVGPPPVLRLHGAVH